MSINVPTIDVGTLKRQLCGVPDDWTIDFSGLTYYRIKQRAPTHLQLEFGEVVYRDAEGRLVVDDVTRDD